jgi:predicted small secreted protein
MNGISNPATMILFALILLILSCLYVSHSLRIIYATRETLTMGCNPTADSRVGPLSQDIARHTPDIAIIRRHERRVLETQIEIESSNDRPWRDADINDGRVIPHRTRPACGLVCIQIKNLTGRQEAGRKKLCIMFVLLGAVLSMMGCNTVRGMGKDIQAVGDGVRDATR